MDRAPASRPSLRRVSAQSSVSLGPLRGSGRNSSMAVGTNGTGGPVGVFVGAIRSEHSHKLASLRLRFVLIRSQEAMK